MINKILGSLLLIIFIILFYQIYKKFFEDKNILKLYSTDVEENFEAGWTENREKYESDNQKLNDVQKTQVQNMIKETTNTQVSRLIADQKPMFAGPSGPPGIQGPPGSKLIIFGRMVNKSGSFGETNENKSKINPMYVCSRTEGTNSSSSLIFMDTISPFSNYQYWQFYEDGTIRSKFDDSVLMMGNVGDKLYMSKLITDSSDSNYLNQRFTWDNTMRIVSKNNSDNKLKCIALTKPEVNTLTTNIPGCKGDACSNSVARRFLVCREFSPNIIKSDEIWSFV